MYKRQLKCIRRREEESHHSDYFAEHSNSALHQRHGSTYDGKLILARLHSKRALCNEIRQDPLTEFFLRK